jgi:2-polyprenyl-3-methyl-5-hydroxy-6-metoxy-1,4-benzoquinol methylase
MNANKEYYLDKYSSELYSTPNPTILDLYAGENVILDVGCGVGALGEEIKRLNKTAFIYGIDISEQACHIAQKKIDNVRVLDLDLNSLPNFDIKFDLIIFGDVLEHLKRPDKTLASAAEHLRTDGSIILSVPNIAFWRIRLGLLFGRFTYQKIGVLDGTHLRFFTYQTITRMIKESGYRIVDEIHVVRAKSPFLDSILKKTWRPLFKIRAPQFVFRIKPSNDLAKATSNEK